MTAQRVVARHELRAAFARSLSTMYGREVPAYTTLVEVASAVNADVLARDPAAAQRLGSIGRVTAERHGAIRIGTPAEMRQVARIFAALGMAPVGFYDLRDASASSVPVVSTAFRPTDRDELALNPFRVFTSMLTVWDEAFFTPDLQSQLNSFFSRRQLFAPEALVLADRAVADDGLSSGDAERFLTLATAAFELSPEPVDRAWYRALEQISPVAADVGGVGSTHINHLTPRVLDIDDLYARMTARGITMIDEIQGPPRWSGPDVLLRQTSFKALAEPRRFTEADGSVATGSLRVRFGEVEARGIALTPAGRALYDGLLAEVDARLTAADPGAADSADSARPLSRSEVAAAVWRSELPDSEQGLAERDLAFFTYARTDRPLPVGADAPRDLAAAIAGGWVSRDPIVYEDFLPRSAAGIFASNIEANDLHKGQTRPGRADTADGRDLAWMAELLERPVADPHELYAAQRRASLSTLAADLGWSADLHDTHLLTEASLKEYV
jgi:uncharacterized glyoxalase superfamily metalloenzyme YdcJ